MKLDSLPPQYVPFKEIEIGSNRHVNGKVPFAVKGHIPLLIGDGESPRVWIYIPADPEGKNWRAVVSDNRSLHPKVEVITKENVVEVRTPDGTVLKVGKVGESQAKVYLIDLRPFGLDIHGDEQKLIVLNNDLIRNSFVNAPVMVRIGKGEESPLNIV